MCRVRAVIDVFNRDTKFIYTIVSGDYRARLLKNAIDFYIDQMSLPQNDPSRIFTNEEYELLIKLYREEFSKFYCYNIFQ